MSYSSEVLADAPILYWRLDTTVGTESDLGSGGHVCTYNGPVVRGVAGIVPTDPDKAARFVPTLSYCETPLVADLKFTNGPWAVEAWIQADAYTGVQTIAQCGEGGGFGYRFNTQGDELGITIPSVDDMVTTLVNLTGRHHVVANFRADADIEFYKDGVLMETVVNANVPAATPTATFGVAVNNGGTEQFKGVIDEVALYASGISAARVAAHYAAGAMAQVAWLRA